MPFFSLRDESGGALYWEIFNAPFDSAKETILLLPPLLGHIGFLRHQYQDVNLSNKYNLLGLEPRHTGRSQARPVAHWDAAVAAADIAFFLDSNDFPAVHIFSPQATSNPIALRLCCLFPERVLSLAIVGPNPVNEKERSPEKADIYDQMVVAWGAGEDPESWAEATHELEVMVYTDDPPNMDDIDLFAHHLGSRTRYQPLDHFAFCINHLNRKSIPDAGLQLIKCPVVIITGTHDLYLCEVDWYKKNLRNADVSTFAIQGAAHGASNTAPNLVNRTMLKFLSGRTWPEDKAHNPVKTDFQSALKRLQLITHDPLASPESRPADRPLSFSTKTKEEAEQFNAMVESMARAGPTEPSIPWGLGGPIYSHDVSKIAHRFSHRHEVDQSIPQQNVRYGEHEWKIQ